MALPVALVARADARAGGAEGAYRPTSARPNNGSVHGHRGQLVDTGGQGLAGSACGTECGTEPQAIKANIWNTAPYGLMTVALDGTSPHSEAAWSSQHTEQEDLQ